MSDQLNLPAFYTIKPSEYFGTDRQSPPSHNALIIFVFWRDITALMYCCGEALQYGFDFVLLDWEFIRAYGKVALQLDYQFGAN